jgi:4-amino-4-deoxy-L-arabinose transferase-like glycosyltransferase
MQPVALSMGLKTDKECDVTASSAADVSPPPGDERADQSFTHWLWILTFCGLLVRLLFLAFEPPLDLIGDERAWTQWADWISDPGIGFSPLRFRLIYRPPLYVYFIAFFKAAFGSLIAVQSVQACVSVALIPAVGRIGRRFFGGRAGLIASALAAFYPESVWFSIHFWSETVFIVLLYWSLDRLLAAKSKRSVMAALLAGFLLGLATLTRETSLYFAPLAALWLVIGSERRREWLRAGVFVAALTLTIAPWTLRNWMLFRAFVPVSTASGLNLWQGNVPLAWNEVHSQYITIPGRINRDRYARHLGLTAIWQRQPTWIFEKLAAQMPLFWEVENFPLRHLYLEAYGPVDPDAYALAALIVLTPYLLTLVCFVLGLAATRFDKGQALIVLFVVYYNMLHVVAHSFSRYRLPVMPALFIFAAQGWMAWRERRLRQTSRRRVAMSVFVGAALAFSVAMSAPTLVQHYHSLRMRMSQKPDGGDAVNRRSEPQREAGRQVVDP